MTFTAGYRAALEDVETIIASRGLMIEPLRAVFRDLDGDAHVIEHERESVTQKRRLRAAREALPLFGSE